MNTSSLDLRRVKKTTEILKEQEEKYKKWNAEPKLLILGASDSGKTTLLRQIQILHGNGFSMDEKLRFRKFIRSSILEVSKLIIEHFDWKNVNFLYSGISTYCSSS